MKIEISREDLMKVYEEELRESSLGLFLRRTIKLLENKGLPPRKAEDLGLTICRYVLDLIDQVIQEMVNSNRDLLEEQLEEFKELLNWKRSHGGSLGPSPSAHSHGGNMEGK